MVSIFNFGSFQRLPIMEQKICWHVQYSKLKYSYVYNMSPFFRGNELHFTTAYLQYSKSACCLDICILKPDQSEFLVTANPGPCLLSRCLVLCKFGFFHLDTEITKIFCRITINKQQDFIIINFFLLPLIPAFFIFTVQFWPQLREYE
jgi:hypothetical protein